MRTLRLASWCIGAGAVRNVMWDALSGKREPSALADVDVAYFDAADILPERDQQLQRALSTIRPDVPWEYIDRGYENFEEKLSGLGAKIRRVPS